MNDKTGRQLAKVLRDVFREDSFETFADLLDAWKYRLARLHLRWTPADLEAALHMVGSNHPLVATPRPVAKAGYEITTSSHAPISREEAAAILARLGWTR